MGRFNNDKSNKVAASEAWVLLRMLAGSKVLPSTLVNPLLPSRSKTYGKMYNWTASGCCCTLPQLCFPFLRNLGRISRRQADAVVEQNGFLWGASFSWLQEELYG